jgi:hypothetical protein
VAYQNAGFFRTTALVNEVAAQSIYNLPSLCFKVESIERVAGASSTPYFLQRISYQPETIQDSRTSFTPRLPTPEQYYQDGQKTFTLARASSATTTNAFRVTYVYYPAKMVADTDVPFQKVAGVGGAGTDDLSPFDGRDAVRGSRAAGCHVSSFHQGARTRSVPAAHESPGAAVRQHHL